MAAHHKNLLSLMISLAYSIIRPLNLTLLYALRQLQYEGVFTKTSLIYICCGLEYNYNTQCKSRILRVHMLGTMSFCQNCKQIITDSEQFVACDTACGFKFHQLCVNLSATELKVIETNGNITWQCDGCLEKSKTFVQVEIDGIKSKTCQRADTTAANYEKQPYKFLFHHKTMIGALTIVMVLSLIGVIASEMGLMSLLGGKNLRLAGNSTIDDFSDNNNESLQLVYRSEWHGRPASTNLTKLNLPVSRVIISHTTSDRCYTLKVCNSRMQIMQKQHMDILRFDDIGYNFAIGGDGRVYVGRGWYKQGAHTKGYNVDSYGISFIGTFTTSEPTQEQVNAAKFLIEEGVRQLKILPNYRLYGARQLSPTDNPGEALFKIIKTWPQFTEEMGNNMSTPSFLRLVNRDCWLAQPPSTELVRLDLPVARIIVLPTNTEMCTTQAACTFRVRFIQTYNIESLQHDDIIYNFLIGGDGNVYEGRGWNFEGAHLKGFNDNSISFAYIGTFKLQNPTAKQLNVTKLLLEEGVSLGKLARDYKIYSANSLEPTLTATSAAALYASFRSWPHWCEQ